MSNQTIDGKTKRRIQHALLRSYPRKGDLAQLVYFELDQNLDEIAGGGALKDVVFNLLVWAESQGKLPLLVRVAAANRPDNAELQSLAQLFQTPATASPQPIPVKQNVIEEQQIYAIGEMEFVEIPAGDFWMGSDDHHEWEKPRHKVYLDTYRISRTPVTNAQYMKFVQATSHASPDHRKEGEIISRRKEHHPVVNISWNDAQAYCQWMSQQTGKWITLPSEAQWEKAARGPHGLIYPWVNNFDARRCNSQESGIGDTTPVGTYPQGASPFGVLDMSGNVWEWVQDWYADDFYANSPQRNPLGPAGGNGKVLRGGCWDDSSENIRASIRLNFAPQVLDDFIGFHCAQEVSP